MTVQHPEVVKHPGGKIDLVVKAVCETSFGAERANSDDTLEQLAETGEDGWAGVRFHTPEITTSVQVANGELAVDDSDERRGNQKEGEDHAVEGQHLGELVILSTKWTYVITTTEEKKVANALFTACSDEASEESTVSMSWKDYISRVSWFLKAQVLPLRICSTTGPANNNMRKEPK